MRSVDPAVGDLLIGLLRTAIADAKVPLCIYSTIPCASKEGTEARDAVPSHPFRNPIGKMSRVFTRLTGLYSGDLSPQLRLM